MRSKKIIVSELLIGVEIAFFAISNFVYASPDPYVQQQMNQMLNSANSDSYSLPNVNYNTGSVSLNSNYLNNAVNDSSYSGISQFQSTTTFSHLVSNSANGTASGSALYNSSGLSQLSSKGGVESKINAPMNNQGQLTTFHRNLGSISNAPGWLQARYLQSYTVTSHTGSAGVYCPSSKPAVEITIVPYSGGYLINLTSPDGKITFDGSTSYALQVSGVCQNGFVQCNPLASWFSSNTDCGYYIWQSTNNGDISYYSSSLPNSQSGAYQSQCSSNNSYNTSATLDQSCIQHNGCLCTNSSCGISSGDPNTIEDIEDYIAGGIEQALENANPDFLIASGTFSISDMTYTIFMQNKSKCNFTSFQQFNNLPPQNPIGNPQAQMEELQYESAPNSPYNLVTGSMTASFGSNGINSQFYTCEMSISPQISSNGSSDQINWNETGQCNPPAGCQIYNETACNFSGNCVQLYYHAEQKDSFIPDCEQLSSALTSYSVCDDGKDVTVTPASNVAGAATGTFTQFGYAQVSKVYICSYGGNKINLNSVNTVISSVSLNNNIMSYDYQNPQGGVQQESGQLPLGSYTQAYQRNCPGAVCNVRYNTNRAPNFGDQTNRNDNVTGSNVTVTKVVSCQWNTQSQQYVCPEDPSAKCHCQTSLNNPDFDESISVLGAIDQAVNDFSCN